MRRRYQNRSTAHGTAASSMQGSGAAELMARRWVAPAKRDDDHQEEVEAPQGKQHAWGSNPGHAVESCSAGANNATAHCQSQQHAKGAAASWMSAAAAIWSEAA